LNNTIKSIYLLFLLGFLQGCEIGAMIPVPARAENMVPLELEEYQTSVPVNMKIGTISGGTESGIYQISQVDNGSLGQALSMSLSRAGLTNSQATQDNTYIVNASLNELLQPSFGLSFTVNSQISYEVTREADGHEIFNDSLSGTGTAGFSDAPTGRDRMRLANEYSIRDNILTFIERISMTLNSE